MTTEEIISALDTVNGAQFTIGRAPTPYHGAYVHSAYQACLLATYPLSVVAFIDAGLPLNAIAEAVRVGVLRVEGAT